MFFRDWSGIFKIIVVGALAYIGLVLILRISGKRTLSKMNAFDMVVTIALGSTLATVLLSRDVPLAEGIAAFLLLIGMQYAIAWISVRSSAFESVIKSEPRLLVHRGKLLRRAMKQERVAEEEIYAAIRAQGLALVSEAAAVVLETDGTFTVVKNSDKENFTAIETLKFVEKDSTRDTDIT